VRRRLNTWRGRSGHGVSACLRDRRPWNGATPTGISFWPSKALNCRTALLALSRNLGDLQEAVDSIDGRLNTQERNSTFVVDFVFDRMDPAAKSSVLQAGFMAERFVCPKGNENCGGPEPKAELIKRYDAEARIQRSVSAVKGTVAELNNVATIASNIGLNIPGLGEAVQYGNVAADGFQSFAAGNYLGAIAAVSGVFKKRVDPEAQPFQLLMNYLTQQFEQINKKLDAILQNQQKMMEALNKLSEQMRDYSWQSLLSVLCTLNATLLECSNSSLPTYPRLETRRWERP
jgi:hypothetical protein